MLVYCAAYFISAAGKIASTVYIVQYDIVLVLQDDSNVNWSRLYKPVHAVPFSMFLMCFILPGFSWALF